MRHFVPNTHGELLWIVALGGLKLIAEIPSEKCSCTRAFLFAIDNQSNVSSVIMRKHDDFQQVATIHVDMLRINLLIQYYNYLSNFYTVNNLL